MKKTQPSICFVTGRTGGHLFPALAVADELNTHYTIRQTFLSTKRGLDAQTLLQEKKEVFMLKVPSSCDSGLLRLWSILSSFFLTGWYLLKNRPTVIMGFGGILFSYVLFWGWLLRIPCIIHEPNLFPGRANRFMSIFATRISLGYPPLLSFFPPRKSSITGVPVRKQLLNENRQTAYKYFSLSPRKTTLLIMGGSQGAHALNQAISDAKGWFDSVSESLQIIHITGAKDYESLRKQCARPGWNVFPFLDDIQLAFDCTDLYVGRAGASAIAELLVKNIPSILIPYPYAKDNHQEVNARYFASFHVCQWIKQESHFSKNLIEMIQKTISSNNLLQKMKNSCKNIARPDAAHMISREIVTIIRKKGTK